MEANNTLVSESYLSFWFKALGREEAVSEAGKRSELRGICGTALVLTFVAGLTWLVNAFESGSPRNLWGFGLVGLFGLAASSVMAVRFFRDPLTSPESRQRELNFSRKEREEVAAEASKNAIPEHLHEYMDTIVEENSLDMSEEWGPYRIQVKIDKPNSDNVVVLYVLINETGAFLASEMFAGATFATLEDLRTAMAHVITFYTSPKVASCS